MRFKVGDEIERIKEEYMGMSVGDKSIVTGVCPDGGVSLKGYDGFHDNDYLKLVGKSKPAKFLLQYERDEDPIEEFQTLEEARKRIKELTKDSEVTQDSFVIYEIKKVYNVEITKQVNLKVAGNK